MPWLRCAAGEQAGELHSWAAHQTAKEDAALTGSSIHALVCPAGGGAKAVQDALPKAKAKQEAEVGAAKHADPCVADQRMATSPGVQSCMQIAKPLVCGMDAGGVAWHAALFRPLDLHVRAFRPPCYLAPLAYRRRRRPTMTP